MTILLYFLAYSILGWMAESLWSAAFTGRLQNRKTLTRLPMCPVYGIGAALLVTLVPRGASPLMIFVYGFFLLSAAEFLYSLVWQHALGVVWWDYSAGRVHLGGRVCGGYSLLWGMLAVFTVKLLHPIIAVILSGAAWYPAAAVMGVLFIADTVQTCKCIQNLPEDECRKLLCFERIEK